MIIININIGYLTFSSKECKYLMFGNESIKKDLIEKLLKEI